MEANLLKKDSSKEYSIKKLEQTVLDSILDKKGERLVSMDLSNILEASTSKFIICEATSPRQVKAIADNVQVEVKKHLKEWPMKVEGAQNAEWILIDYFDIMVHVFQKEKREFYQLEELWSDAVFTNYDS